MAMMAILNLNRDETFMSPIVSIPNPQLSPIKSGRGGLGNEFVYFFSLCLCGERIYI